MLNSLPWKWTKIILSFLKLHPSTTFRLFVNYEGYSISFKQFLPTVVDIIVMWINLPIPVHLSSLIPKDVSVHSCHLLLDHVQFTLIHGPNIPGSYVILFFTSMTECHFCFDPASSFFLEVLVIAFYSSQVAYWTPSHLGGSCSSVISFFPFILFMGFSWQKKTLVVCLSFFQWTTFCQNSSLWPTCLGWPCKAWLIASLSYRSPITMTRLWSVKGLVWHMR